MGNGCSQVWDNLLDAYFTDRGCTKVLMLGLDGAGKTTLLMKMSKGFDFVSGCTPPTYGFISETIRWNGFRFSIWEVGGSPLLRHLWRHYFPNTNGVIFVVDAADRGRGEEARNELYKLMKGGFEGHPTTLAYPPSYDEDDLFLVEDWTKDESQRLQSQSHPGDEGWLDAPVYLILVTKRDVQGSFTIPEIAKVLELEPSSDEDDVAKEKEEDEEQEVQSRQGEKWGKVWRIQNTWGRNGEGCSEGLDWLVKQLKRTESEVITGL